MASKNNRPAKKTAGKPKTRKPKKPKVKISKSKALLCASIIFAVCGILLSVSVIASEKAGFPGNETSVKPASQVAPDTPDRTAASGKNAASDKNSTKKAETSKSSQKSSDSKKTETKKQDAKKTEPKKTDTKKNEKPVSEQKPAEISGGKPSSESEKNDGIKTTAVPQTPSQSTQPQSPQPEITEAVTPPVMLPELEPFPIPDAVGNPVITFVFDDGGHNLNQLQKILELPFPVSVAVLPKLAYSKESARRVRASGKQLLLHQPMETLGNNATLGEGAIMANMSGQDARTVLLQNISEIAPVAGINNHEGSKVSENQFLMETVLLELKRQNIFYLDSRTTSQTRAPQAALELGIEIFERDIFLDNVKTRENILKEIEKGVKIANIKGKSIMIGHVWSADILPEILEEVVPLLMLRGYRIEVLNK